MNIETENRYVHITEDGWDGFVDELSESFPDTQIEEPDIKDEKTIAYPDNTLFNLKLKKTLENHKAPTVKMRRVTTLTPPEKVPRPTNIIAIGDLHGNINALWGNFNAAGLLDKNKKWIAGNTHVVLHGDILADRHPNGISIMKEVTALQKQAELQGGQIIVLAGNHDDFATSFLMNIKDAHGKDFWDYPTALNGMSDFHQYTNAKDKTLIISDGYMKDNYHSDEILSNLKATEDGKELLDSIVNMKILEQIDDTLFVHTNITHKMAKLIRTIGIDKINKIYIEGKRKILIDEPKGHLPKKFKEIQKAFLHTKNRESSYMNEKDGEMLKMIGINHVFHGHTNNKFNNIIIGGVRITSVDNSAYKAEHYTDTPSIASISPDYKITNAFNNEICYTSNLYKFQGISPGEVIILQHKGKITTLTFLGRRTKLKNRKQIDLYVLKFNDEDGKTISVTSEKFQLIVAKARQYASEL